VNVFCNIQSSDQILESTSVTSNKFKQILVTQNMVKSFDDIAPFGYGIVETNYWTENSFAMFLLQSLDL